MSEEDVCSIVDTRAAIQSTLSTSRFRRAMTSRQDGEPFQEGPGDAFT